MKIGETRCTDGDVRKICWGNGESRLPLRTAVDEDLPFSTLASRYRRAGLKCPLPILCRPEAGRCDLQLDQDTIFPGEFLFEMLCEEALTPGLAVSPENERFVLTRQGRNQTISGRRKKTKRFLSVDVFEFPFQPFRAIGSNEDHKLSGFNGPVHREIIEF